MKTCSLSGWKARFRALALSALRVSVLPVSCPSASRRTVTASGRLPSWSFASSQTFFTDRAVFSGAWVLVMVKPSAASPVIEGW